MTILVLAITTFVSIADDPLNSSIVGEKQPWEYVGEMDFDFDTEEFAGPAFGFGAISYRPPVLAILKYFYLSMST